MPKPEKLEEIKKEFGKTKNPNKIHNDRLSALDKLALVVTEKIGTMGFFFIIFIWTVGWLGWNVVAPHNLRFDPYPAFVLWLFISNLIQIHLMPLIMIGQNIQGQHAEIRADQDFETNVKAEKEIETIILHLENQNKVLEEITTRLNKLDAKR
ncbi:MAG TPA: DUF1003 domain-containing protein [Candidatus Saccharimonadales bacterium]|nr:DUF1003 domain-containing protein [Candidatus Saccharimonadales bacterium]